MKFAVGFNLLYEQKRSSFEFVDMFLWHLSNPVEDNGDVNAYLPK